MAEMDETYCLALQGQIPSLPDLEMTFVGRAGSDTIDGGDGNNSYSPWPSLNDPSIGNLADLQTTSITGGSDLDIVYLRGLKS